MEILLEIGFKVLRGGKRKEEVISTREKNHKQRFIGRKEQVTQRIMSLEMNSNKYRKVCGSTVQDPGTLSTET